MYGKMEYCEDEDDCFTNFETKFPAIVLDNTLIFDAAISCGPMVSPLNNNEIDFRISFDESDDEDYTVVYDENSLSYKIIYVNNLKTASENDNDKVTMPSFPSPEPETEQNRPKRRHIVMLCESALTRIGNPYLAELAKEDVNLNRDVFDPSSSGQLDRGSEKIINVVTESP
ncbi:hypothetical protein Tco_0639368 [Tanacetum coccineum]